MQGPIAMLALMAFLPLAALGQDRPAAVGVDEVLSETYSQTAPVLGRIVARQSGSIAARVAGPVASVEVSVGDTVEAGDPLVRLDETRLATERDMVGADLRAAESELATARAQVELLEQERRRLERLRDSAAFSAAALADKSTEIAVAQSRVDSALARVERASVMASLRQTDLEDAVMRAPYPGVVVRKLASEGAYVRVGDPVVELVNHQNVEIEADVPAELMAGLTRGTIVEFATAGRMLKASLRAVIPVENAMTRTRAVRFVPEAASVSVADAIGQSVTMQLPTGAPRDVVTVHKDAVLVRQGSRMVFRVAKENTVEPVMIQVGSAVGSRFEVTAGLAPGDLVVVRGNERLRPGQAVQFEPPQASGNEQGETTPSVTPSTAAKPEAEAGDRS